MINRQATGTDSPTIAPLRNVLVTHLALCEAMRRDTDLPGMVALFGPSGIGKTKAAAYCANKHRAFFVQIKKAWTGKALMLNICTSMGIHPKRTVYEMLDQIAEHLVVTQRPLIIDDFDYAIDKGYAETARDIYESSGAAILLIGEEYMPEKMRRWERLHNRILIWQQGLLCDLSDAKHLVKLYAKGIVICDDLLELIIKQTNGCTRRISTNIAAIRRHAIDESLTDINQGNWDTNKIMDGRSPAPRRNVRMS